jgi:hypothetical protein
MKGVDYFKELYANVMNRLVVARDSVTQRYHTIAELVHRMEPPISEQMKNMLERHDLGLNMLFYDTDHLNPVMEWYRPGGSDITEIMTKETNDGRTVWTTKRIVTEQRLPDGRWAINPAYITPQLEEEISIRDKFKLHEMSLLDLIIDKVFHQSEF